MFSVLIKSKGTISKEAEKNISPRTDYFINFFLSFLRFLSVPSYLLAINVHLTLCCAKKSRLLLLCYFLCKINNEQGTRGRFLAEQPHSSTVNVSKGNLSASYSFAYEEYNGSSTYHARNKWI